MDAEKKLSSSLQSTHVTTTGMGSLQVLAAVQKSLNFSDLMGPGNFHLGIAEATVSCYRYITLYPGPPFGQSRTSTSM